MSYILEALRKSENERRQEEIPLLQAVHAPRQSIPPKTNHFSAKLLPWIVTLILLLGTTLGILFWQGQLPILRLEKRPMDLPEQQQAASVSEGPALEKGIPAPKPNEGLRQKKAELSLSPEAIEGEDQHILRTVIREPAPLTLSPENDEEIPVRGRKTIEIPKSMHMSPAAQADLQKMKFVGHVYSEDRGSRMIMINNKILREGDGIDADFHLDEITGTGVVLLYHSTRIPIDLF
jgi:general secretion pathway protein B